MQIGFQMYFGANQSNATLCYVVLRSSWNETGNELKALQCGNDKTEEFEKFWNILKLIRPQIARRYPKFGREVLILDIYKAKISVKI